MTTPRVRLCLLVSLLAGAAGCVADGDVDAQAAAGAAMAAGATAFVGATIFDGTGGPAVPDAVLLVRDGRVVAVAPVAGYEMPADADVVDVSGMTIIPGIINAHGHVGLARGLEQGAEHHTRANILEQLALYANYGVTTVVSLGEPGYEGVAVRDAQLAAPRAIDRARIFVAGVVLDPGAPAEAEAQVRERAARGVDWAKIRVDDFLGRAQKMSPATYGAVIRHSHAHGLPLTAHMVTLEDAKGLVDAGTDVLGHSVRDAVVDDTLIRAMLEGDVCLHPTLTRELSTYVYAERPAFFDDPFFLQHADPAVVRELEQPARQRQYTGEAADYYRAALPVAMRNMMTLHDAGVRIAFGTDSGPPGRFQGFFEHVELEMMQDAGMAPRDILVSATRDAAACMRLADVGALIPGLWADFVVLRDNPLDDIRNSRSIEAVWIGGNRVAGAAQR
jgi:imidazolonepropionase-like amidohydrolase